MPVTLKDIAKVAGVTSATVSMVINNKPNISKATRERVLKIAKDLNYYPNVIARGLATRKTNAIGIIVPNLASSFIVRVLQGIKSSIQEESYTVLLFDTVGKDQTEADVYNRVIRESRVDGAILIGANSNEEELQIFQRENLPCILVARKSERMDSIYVNNEGASQEAVSYLISKGHRNIALVKADKISLQIEERVNGYKRALAFRSIEYRDDMVFTVEDDKMTDGTDVVAKILALAPRPTAVFCPAGDMVAIGIIKALKQNGLSVPEDMAVVGYDDLPAAEVVEPRLTTVRQPKLEMGDDSIKLIIDKVEGRQTNQIQKELQAKLIERESV